MLLLGFLLLGFLFCLVGLGFLLLLFVLFLFLFFVVVVWLWKGNLLSPLLFCSFIDKDIDNLLALLYQLLEQYSAKYDNYCQNILCVMQAFDKENTHLLFCSRCF